MFSFILILNRVMLSNELYEDFFYIANVHSRLQCKCIGMILFEVDGNRHVRNCVDFVVAHRRKTYLCSHNF